MCLIFSSLSLFLSFSFPHVSHLNCLLPLCAPSSHLSLLLFLFITPGFVLILPSVAPYLCLCLSFFLPLFPLASSPRHHFLFPLSSLAPLVFSSLLSDLQFQSPFFLYLFLHLSSLIALPTLSVFILFLSFTLIHPPSLSVHSFPIQLSHIPIHVFTTAGFRWSKVKKNKFSHTSLTLLYFSFIHSFFSYSYLFFFYFISSSIYYNE